MSGSTSGTSFSDPASSLSALSSGDLAVIIFLISTCDREAKQKGVEEMSQNCGILPEKRILSVEDCHLSTRRSATLLEAYEEIKWGSVTFFLQYEGPSGFSVCAPSGDRVGKSSGLY
ncbi:hypothetical protein NPIL_55131 [Nephila pilipes]|uniref:Uncharacterized protein n=1 Tax=Nephila pilipes TaxID=299642 RepID=A0A8X6NDM0_NEPPI|nr:hypothetical protein NPIL_305731 [Nephila pilipes]GFT92410.1 hypothetical protein NPIL_55131 [Nephila pilipes]